MYNFFKFCFLLTIFLYKFPNYSNAQEQEFSLEVGREELSLPRYSPPILNLQRSTDELSLPEQTFDGDNPTVLFSIEKIPGYETPGGWHDDILSNFSVSQLAQYRQVSRRTQNLVGKKIIQDYLVAGLPIVMNLTEIRQDPLKFIEGSLHFINSFSQPLKQSSLNVALINFCPKPFAIYGRNGEIIFKLPKELFQNVESLKISTAESNTKFDSILMYEFFKQTHVSRVKNLFLENNSEYSCARVQEYSKTNFKNFLQLFSGLENLTCVNRANYLSKENFSTGKNDFFGKKIELIAGLGLAQKLKGFEFAGHIAEASLILNRLLKYAQNFSELESIKIIGISRNALPALQIDRSKFLALKKFESSIQTIPSSENLKKRKAGLFDNLPPAIELGQENAPEQEAFLRQPKKIKRNLFNE